jgi:hypothetical protein
LVDSGFLYSFTNIIDDTLFDLSPIRFHWLLKSILNDIKVFIAFGILVGAGTNLFYFFQANKGK